MTSSCAITATAATSTTAAMIALLRHITCPRTHTHIGAAGFHLELVELSIAIRFRQREGQHVKMAQFLFDLLEDPRRVLAEGKAAAARLLRQSPQVPLRHLEMQSRRLCRRSNRINRSIRRLRSLDRRGQAVLATGI